MDRRSLVEYLRRSGLLSGSEPDVIPLAGGVSSDVLLVADGRRSVVVKQSLEKLRVKADWHSNTARNTTEYEAIRYASSLFPDAVPELLQVDRENRLFVMEYLGEEYTPWKSQLLQGRIDLALAGSTAKLLATLHSQSWMRPELRAQFNTGADFHDLRIEPYLLTTGQRHPHLRDHFEAEANRLQSTSLALVHGDWSAKNILVSPGRSVVLDWEVAWFGDPAFDAAFFLNLLYLKSLFNRSCASEYLALMREFRETYRCLMPHFDEQLARRIVQLTLLLMLARIDGKSPVEYITSESDKELVRAFVGKMLNDGVDNFQDVDVHWRKALLLCQI
jgi:aminoglycoside phosphotransferase (APT) family kinase protein